MFSKKDMTLPLKVIAIEAVRLLEEDTGIHLTRKQKKIIQQAIVNANEDDHTFKLSKKQERQLINIGLEKDINLNDYAQRILDGEKGEISDLIKKEIEYQSIKALTGWIKKSNKRKKAKDRGFRKVQNQIRHMYGAPIEEYKTLLHMGGEINDLIFERAIEEEPEKPYLYIALHRLHLQSQRVSREIILLIESGYADGAMARWRTLHEYSIIAKFLKEKGTEAAERYLDFRYIERYKDAERQFEAKNPNKFDLATQEDVEQHEEKVSELKKKYGEGFASKMGWAKPYLAGKSSNIFDLEKEVQFDQYRPIVNMSHHSIHAGAQSLYFQLGQPPYNPGSIITGPSAYGIIDPLQFSIGSYYSISIDLFIHMNSFEVAKHLNPFGDLYKEAYNAIRVAYNKYSENKKQNPKD